MRISQVPIVKAIAVSTGYRATLERQNPRHIRQILHGVLMIFFIPCVFLMPKGFKISVVAIPTRRIWNADAHQNQHCFGRGKN
jgi:hypothetical protein